MLDSFTRCYAWTPHRRRPLLLTAGTAPLVVARKTRLPHTAVQLPGRSTMGRPGALLPFSFGPAEPHTSTPHPPGKYPLRPPKSPVQRVRSPGVPRRMGAAVETQHTRPGATIVADLPISRVCTTTLGCVQVGSSPCRRGGLLTEPSPISGPPGSGPRRDGLRTIPRHAALQAPAAALGARGAQSRRPLQHRRQRAAHRARLRVGRRA